MSETWLSDKGVYDADRSMIVEGMLPSVGAPTREDYYAEKMGYLPFNKRSRMTIRIQESLEPGETKEIRIRGAGQMVLIRNAASEQEEWALSGIRPEDIPVITNDSFVTVGGEFWRKPRLNNNYQTGNLPTIGNLSRILSFPSDVDNVHYIVVMDSDGALYLRYTNLSGDRRNLKLDRNYDTVWDVAEGTYGGGVSPTPNINLAGDYVIYMGHTGGTDRREPFVYSQDDGSWVNDGITLYGHCGSLWFSDGNFIYADRWNNNDWWKLNLISGDKINDFANNTRNIGSGPITVFNHAFAQDNSNKDVYYSDWAGVATKLFDDFEICAQDENGTFYGFSTAADDFAAYDVSGNLLWARALSTIHASGYWYKSYLSVAVDEHNGIVYVAYGYSTEFHVCAMDRSNGSILWNRIIGKDARIGVASGDNSINICVDKYGIIIGYNYYSGGASPIQSKGYLVIYDSIADNRNYELYDDNYTYKQVFGGLINSIATNRGACSGWGRYIWGNPSADASNVGGLYVLT